MRTLIHQLAENSRQAGAVTLVVGAGNGSELTSLRELGSRRLVLVEACPEVAARLVAQVDASLGEEVWPVAVTGAVTGSATLHLVNHASYSSLKAPARLLTLLPNLRVVGQREVPASTLREVIENLALVPDGDNVLVLDAPGQAYDLLQATPASALQCFSSIVVRCDCSPLYAGDMETSQLIDLVREAGYEVAGEDPQSVYPQVAMLLARDDDRVRRGRLEEQLSQERRERSDLADSMKELRDALQAVSEERDAHALLAEERNTAIEAALRDGAEGRKQIAALQEQVETLTRNLEAKSKLASDMKQALDAAEKAASEHERMASERQELIAKLGRQSQQRGGRVIELEREIGILNRRQAWFDEEIAKAEAQIDLIKELVLRD